MKSINILFLFVMLSASQVYSQQFFSSAALVHAHKSQQLNFVVPKEVNVMYYRVEACNDTNDFEVIGRVISLGNTMLPRVYHYELYTTAYKYFRIGMAGMDGNLHYSQLINNVEPAQHTEPLFKPAFPDTNHAIANSQ